MAADRDASTVKVVPTPRRSTPGAAAPADTRRRVAVARATAIVRVDSDLAARAVAARAQRGTPRTEGMTTPKTASFGASALARPTIDWPVEPLGEPAVQASATVAEEASARVGFLSRIRGWLGRAG